MCQELDAYKEMITDLIQCYLKMPTAVQDKARLLLEECVLQLSSCSLLNDNADTDINWKQENRSGSDRCQDADKPARRRGRSKASKVTDEKEAITKPPRKRNRSSKYGAEFELPTPKCTPGDVVRIKQEPIEVQSRKGKSAGSDEVSIVSEIPPKRGRGRPPKVKMQAKPTSETSIPRKSSAKTYEVDVDVSKTEVRASRPKIEKIPRKSISKRLPRKPKIEKVAKQEKPKNRTFKRYFSHAEYIKQWDRIKEFVEVLPCVPGAGEVGPSLTGNDDVPIDESESQSNSPPPSDQCNSPSSPPHMDKTQNEGVQSQPQSDEDDAKDDVIKSEKDVNEPVLNTSGQDNTESEDDKVKEIKYNPDLEDGTPQTDPKTKNNSTFRCRLCGHSVCYKISIQSHLWNQHFQDLKPFLCHICGKSFCKAQKLKMHQAVHTTEKNFQCDQCVFMTHSGHLLANHIRNVHATEKLQWSCKVCDFTTHYKSSLDDHMRRHLGNRPFKCDICNKGFTSCSNLGTHKRFHKERVFVCEHCNKKFATRAKLGRHSVIHTGKKEFACTLCNYLCNMRSNLTKHLKAVHKLNVASLHPKVQRVELDSQGNVVELPPPPADQPETEFVLVQAKDEFVAINPHSEGMVIKPHSKGMVVIQSYGEMVIPPHSKGMVIQPNSEDMVAQPHSEGMVIQPHSEGMVSQPHSEGMVIQPHSEGMVVQSHSEGMVTQPHIEGMVIQPHSEGMVIQSHSEGMVTQPLPDGVVLMQTQQEAMVIQHQSDGMVISPQGHTLVSVGQVVGMANQLHIAAEDGVPQMASFVEISPGSQQEIIQGSTADEAATQEVVNIPMPPNGNWSTPFTVNIEYNS